MGHSRPSTSSQPAFAALEPRVRHISETTIRKKWKRLPPSSQDKVKQVLLSLKRQSRVGQKYLDSKKMRGLDAADIETCVEEVADKLMQRLPRMPFPPSTDEQQFDFEATLDRIRTLEDQLTSNLQSMALLRTQIAMEQQMLRQDKAELSQLEDALKSSEALRRKESKTLHPLAKNLRPAGEKQETSKGDVYVNEGEKESGSEPISVLEQDLQIRPLLSQLRNHLGSMRNNTSSMRPVAHALSDAQHALDIFTYRTLDMQQYHLLYGLET